MCFGGGKIPQPAPVKEVARVRAPDKDVESSRARVAGAARAGFGSTVATGGQGVQGDAVTARKRLLGT